MANTKISSLASATSVTDTTIVPVVDGSTTKKVTGAQIKTHAQSGLATVATTGSYSDLTNNPTTLVGSTASGGINPTQTAVILDNIKIRYTPTEDNQYTYTEVATVTGSATIRTSTDPKTDKSITTSWSTLTSSSANTEYTTFILFDVTNNKTYRITLMILDGNTVPPGRLANTKQMILIERLV